MSYGDNPEMLDYIDHLEAENERLREANKHLKDQLTWRPVSEEPTLKEMGKILCKNNDTKISIELWGIALEDWEDFVKRLNVVKWLPIPPAPQGE